MSLSIINSRYSQNIYTETMDWFSLGIQKEGFIDSLEAMMLCYINTDGLQLTHSNSNYVWPIQVLIPPPKNYLFVCRVPRHSIQEKRM
jgi:hypothetical protein